MSKVERSDLVDYQTYEEQRDELRKEAMAAKRPRRIHVGEHFTFLFENAVTMRYQVQEMMRTEKIVREQDIQHELDTYNELLGENGALGCTLLIELTDPEERDAKLRQWLGLIDHVYARTASGREVRASYDPRQVGDDRLSSVQYLKFPLAGEAPVAIGIDFKGIEAETELDAEQQAALAADLQ